jgi:hypothetical protein
MEEESKDGVDMMGNTIAIMSGYVPKMGLFESFES